MGYPGTVRFMSDPRDHYILSIDEMAILNLLWRLSSFPIQLGRRMLQEHLKTSTWRTKVALQSLKQQRIVESSPFQGPSSGYTLNEPSLPLQVLLGYRENAREGYFSGGAIDPYVLAWMLLGDISANAAPDCANEIGYRLLLSIRSKAEPVGLNRKQYWATHYYEYSRDEFPVLATMEPPPRPAPVVMLEALKELKPNGDWSFYDTGYGIWEFGRSVDQPPVLSLLLSQYVRITRMDNCGSAFIGEGDLPPTPPSETIPYQMRGTIGAYRDALTRLLR